MESLAVHEPEAELAILWCGGVDSILDEKTVDFRVEEELQRHNYYL